MSVDQNRRGDGWRHENGDRAQGKGHAKKKDGFGRVRTGIGYPKAFSHLGRRNALHKGAGTHQICSGCDESWIHGTTAPSGYPVWIVSSPLTSASALPPTRSPTELGLRSWPHHPCPCASSLAASGTCSSLKIDQSSVFKTDTTLSFKRNRPRRSNGALLVSISGAFRPIDTCTVMSDEHDRPRASSGLRPVQRALHNQLWMKIDQNKGMASY